ncbi:MAG: hypothetical protein Sapg2KO_05570 [Saprospiraceae bacterium]
MLKFFRRIRQKLLSEGKLRRYFVYAIGEIFLVVIGIVIALQFNNWNEERKNRDNIEVLLDKIETDIRIDLDYASSVISEYKKKDSLVQLVLKDQVSKQDYLDNPELRNLLTFRLYYGPIQDNFLKLVSKEEDVPKEYTALVDQSKLISLAYRDIELGVENWNKSVMENYEYLTHHLPRHGMTDSLSINKEIDFFLTEKSYRGKVNLSNKMMREALFYCANYRHTSLIMLINLKQLRERFDKVQIQKLLSQFDLTPFDRINCQTSFEKSDPDLIQAYLLLNLSKEPVQLRRRSANETSYTIIDLKPGQIRRRTVFKGPTDIYEQVAEGSCIESYTSRNEGYLLIE